MDARAAHLARHRAARMRARAAEQEAASARPGIGWPLRRVYESSASSLAAEADRLNATADTLERACSNPKDSPWYATPRGARKRKPLAITLSDEARAKLDALAARGGESRSAVVERLLTRAR